MEPIYMKKKKQLPIGGDWKWMRAVPRPFDWMRRCCQIFVKRTHRKSWAIVDHGADLFFKKKDDCWLAIGGDWKWMKAVPRPFDWMRRCCQIFFFCKKGTHRKSWTWWAGGRCRRCGTHRRRRRSSDSNPWRRRRRRPIVGRRSTRRRRRRRRWTSPASPGDGTTTRNRRGRRPSRNHGAWVVAVVAVAVVAVVVVVVVAVVVVAVVGASVFLFVRVVHSESALPRWLPSFSFLLGFFLGPICFLSLFFLLLAQHQEKTARRFFFLVFFFYWVSFRSSEWRVALCAPPKKTFCVFFFSRVENRPDLLSRCRCFFVLFFFWFLGVSISTQTHTHTHTHTRTRTH